MHRYYGPNQTGRDFVVGDIHGCYDTFVLGLKDIEFDYAHDRMFSVGDLIDRGPCSAVCLQLTSEPWFHAVRGNHEMFMINNDTTVWYANGGDWYMDLPEPVKTTLRNLACALPYAITLDHSSGAMIGICHAESPTGDWNLIDSFIGHHYKSQQMVWGRDCVKKQTEKIKHIDFTFHGHTPTTKVVERANSVWIDTGAVYGGPLTIINLEEFILGRTQK